MAGLFPGGRAIWFGSAGRRAHFCTRLARVPIVRAKLVYARGATWRQSPRTLCATRANLSFGGASRRPSLPPSLSLPSHWISIGSHGSIGSIGSNSNKSVAILAEAAHRNWRWRSPPGSKWPPPAQGWHAQLLIRHSFPIGICRRTPRRGPRELFEEVCSLFPPRCCSRTLCSESLCLALPFPLPALELAPLTLTPFFARGNKENTRRHQQQQRRQQQQQRRQQQRGGINTLTKRALFVADIWDAA